MEKKREKLIKAIKKSLASSRELRTAEEIAQDILPAINRKRCSEALVDEVRYILEVDLEDEILSKESDVFDEVFMSGQSFFNGAHFIINITELEVQNKCIIPGHRFIPFTSTSIFPSECEFYDGEQAFATTRKNFKLSEIHIFLTLFGEMGTLEYLLADDALEEADQFDPSPSSNIEITVYECERFFEENEIRAGDKLLVRVLDYELGDLIIEKIIDKDDPVSFIDMNRQLKMMDEYLEETFDLCGAVDVSIEQQFRQAIFEMGDDYISRPAFHLGGYLQLTDKVSIKRSIHNHILWYADEDPIDSIDLDEMVDDIKDSVFESPLDLYLSSFGIDVTMTEIRAHMKNELFNGATKPEGAYNAAFETFREDWEECSEDLRPLLEEMWQNEKARYNRFKDEPYGELRAKLLHVNQALHEFCKHADETVSDLGNIGKKEVIGISQLLQAVLQFLVALNEDEIEIPAQEAKLMSEKIEEMLAFVQVMDSSLEDVKNQMKMKQSRIQSEEQDQEVYCFKVSLDEDKSTYRKVEICGHQTLDELHNAIFQAFDRFDPHLYSFFITRKRTSSYRTRMNAPEYTILDSGGEYFELSGSNRGNVTETLVTHLNLNENDKFYYLFDFGDEWWHEITVENVSKKLVDPDEFPRIVARKGASPPQYRDLDEE